MEVKAINGVSQLGFEGRFGKSKKTERDNASHPQIDAPASRKSSAAMRALLYGALALGSAGAVTSCNKDTFGIGADSYSYSQSNAEANAVYVPVDPKVIHDTTHVVLHDTIKVPEIKYDTVYVPKVIENHDTIYVPEVHTDTVYVPKTITERDTIIKTVVVPINVKNAPWHLVDSIIAQGKNIGIPLEGPEPSQTENHVLFIGSKAYNEYDYQLYETQLDSIGTNAEQLSLITKITDFYDGENNPKVSYMKTTVVDVPGEGIRLDRFVMSDKNVRRYGFDENNAPKSSHFGWEYAGHEIRTNNRNGKNNRVIVFDKYGQPLNGAKGEYIKGNELGSFLYGTYIYDESGNPYIDESTGQPEKAYYDFSKGKMWSTEVKKVEGTNGYTF